jgi:Domain of unknown function (DUF4126)
VELIPTAISAGYAAGLNAYGTVLLLGLLGKSGFGEVPFADLDQVTGSEEVAAVGAGGSTAFLSHGLKAGLRLGINTSPEPFSNIFVSLIEDGRWSGVGSGGVARRPPRCRRPRREGPRAARSGPTRPPTA